MLGTPEYDDIGNVTSGDLLLHDKDRHVVDSASAADWPREVAVLYTGKVPDDTVIVL